MQAALKLYNCSILHFCSWISSVLFNILRDFRLLPKSIAEQEFMYGVVTHAVAMTSTVGYKFLEKIYQLHQCLQ